MRTAPRRERAVLSAAPFLLHGNYLKSGGYFYYPNGNQLASGSYLYHPNGNNLRSGSYFYYANGNNLQSGSYLYYPTGNNLRSGEYYYYANGNALKSGSHFYYKNGNAARSGSYLYREDGSQTEFPVSLVEPVGDVGSLRWTVGRTAESLTFDFDRFVDAEQVRARLDFDGASLVPEFAIETGHPGEQVVVRFAADGSFDCRLSSGDSSPREFTLTHDAATVRVEVRQGYDPAAIRRALEAALDGLR